MNKTYAILIAASFFMLQCNAAANDNPMPEDNSPASNIKSREFVPDLTIKGSAVICTRYHKSASVTYSWEQNGSTSWVKYAHEGARSESYVKQIAERIAEEEHPVIPARELVGVSKRPCDWEKEIHAHGIDGKHLCTKADSDQELRNYFGVPKC